MPFKSQIDALKQEKPQHIEREKGGGGQKPKGWCELQEITEQPIRRRKGKKPKEKKKEKTKGFELKQEKYTEALFLEHH